MKRKKSLKRFFRYTIFIGIVLALIFYIYPKLIVSDTSDIVKMGYSLSSVKKIEKLGISAKVRDNEYSQTLDIALSENEYKKDYLSDYLKIKHVTGESFIESVNKLLEKGYSSDEINKIYENISVEDSKILMNMDRNAKVFDYVGVKYFKIENLERYISYGSKNDYSKENVVIYVNINLDKEFYSDIKEIKNTDDPLVLVNKYNSLPNNFEAKNLTTFSDKYSYNSQKMNKVAAENIIKLIDDARNEGYKLWVVSGYRTTAKQKSLYDTSLQKNGKAHAEAYSARPGHSEHQTGLAVDISDIAGVIDGFENRSVYAWVKVNAHKYGFIERYPKGKEFITGYGYEPWHYRYVGTEVATTIYKENITFEEYTVKYLN